MSDLTILHRPQVRLIDHMGSDKSVVRAARVSVLGANDREPAVIFHGDPTLSGQAQADEVAARAQAALDKKTKKDNGLVNYLMGNAHGSPFEHTAMTFFVKAPIFVFREFMRHRMASYNEMSGRYTELPCEFYMEPPERPIVNIGSGAHPKLVPGTTEQYDFMVESSMRVYELAWTVYQEQLEAGIATEVARKVLPVGIMSQMYVTMNLRGLMNFLKLRTDDVRAAKKSNPQWEIEQVARKLEEEFEKKFPVTYKTWNDNGRICP